MKHVYLPPLYVILLICFTDATIGNSVFMIQYKDVKHTYYGSVTSSSSVLDCAHLCHKMVHCESFQYDKHSGQCVTHPVSFQSRWGFEATPQSGNEVYCKHNSHALGSRCNVDSDCGVINSTCFDGACACIPGYSFSQSDSICVRGCPVYGHEATLYPGHAIDGYSLKVLFGVVSVQDCAAGCVAESDFLCVSFNYELIPQNCFLSPVNYLDADAINRIQGSDRWIFGSRDCAP